jgi:hypothetical protein
MSVTEAFLAGFIVSVPILIVLVVAIVIWRCNVVSRRKKKLNALHEIVLYARPSAVSMVPSEGPMHEEPPQPEPEQKRDHRSSNNVLEISEVPNS